MQSKVPIYITLLVHHNPAYWAILWFTVLHCSWESSATFQQTFSLNVKKVKALFFYTTFCDLQFQLHETMCQSCQSQLIQTEEHLHLNIILHEACSLLKTDLPNCREDLLWWHGCCRNGQIWQCGKSPLIFPFAIWKGPAFWILQTLNFISHHLDRLVCLSLLFLFTQTLSVRLKEVIQCHFLFSIHNQVPLCFFDSRDFSSTLHQSTIFSS